MIGEIDLDRAQERRESLAVLRAILRSQGGELRLKPEHFQNCWDGTLTCYVEPDGERVFKLIKEGQRDG